MSIIRNLSFDDYRRLDGVNSSTLKKLNESPLHYRHAIDNPDEGPVSPSTQFGQAVHLAVLEPDELPLRVAVWTGGTRRGKAWDDFQHANTGRLLLKADEYKQALAVRDAVRANPIAAPYLDGPGDFELSMQWTDEATGIQCKGRVDRLQHRGRFGRVLVDLKTARTIDRRLFAAQAARLAYHEQLDFYRTGLAACGQAVDKVVVIAVESAAPHDCAVFELGDEALYAGECGWRSGLEKIAECRAGGDWHGRYTAEELLDLPAWAFGLDDEDDDDGFGLRGVRDA